LPIKKVLDPHILQMMAPSTFSVEQRWHRFITGTASKKIAFGNRIETGGKLFQAEVAGKHNGNANPLLCEVNADQVREMKWKDEKTRRCSEAKTLLTFLLTVRATIPELLRYESNPRIHSIENCSLDSMKPPKALVETPRF
jgi:hypothetical protein